MASGRRLSRASTASRPATTLTPPASATTSPEKRRQVISKGRHRIAQRVMGVCMPPLFAPPLLPLGFYLPSPRPFSPLSVFPALDWVATFRRSRKRTQKRCGP